MEQKTIQTLFALLRSTICGTKLSEAEKKQFSSEQLPELIAMSRKHDILHLLALGIKQNALTSDQASVLERSTLSAIYRYEQLNYEYGKLCKTLEAANIPFMPLKGSVLRKYYPEAWMRTSCDVDVLVHEEDLQKATSILIDTCGYSFQGKGPHDISLFAPNKMHIELHYNLMEAGRMKAVSRVLNSVWESASVRDGYRYWYEMPDEMFYFYHIAHMAKHFENGGCGIRSFIDIWLLDHLEGAEQTKRDAMLSAGGLLLFADAARKLSRGWLDGAELDAVSRQMQDFILHGGIYGSSDNRVTLQQQKRGGRIRYILSRAFIPYVNLKRYYPILEKHPWLTPFMHVRRWFMLLKPDIARKAKYEMAVSSNIEKTQASEMNHFLKNIGL